MASKEVYEEKIRSIALLIAQTLENMSLTNAEALDVITELEFLVRSSFRT
jgi:hypothetical protein